MKKSFVEFDFKTRHAGVSTLITIAVLAGAIILNILAGELELQADLTPKKLFSLTDDSLELLDGLEEPVEIIALYKPGTEPEILMEAVLEYDRKSRNVTVSVVDPDRDPALVARYSEGGEAVPRGSFIVATAGEHRVIPGMDLYDRYGPQGQVMGQKVEQQMTAAISYVITGRTPAIYEITGHRETPLAGLGYQAPLTSANYVLEELSLIRSDIPEDAALVTLIGPRTDLSAAEVDKLDAYLEDGGSLLVALDLSAEPPTNLYGLLRKWDIDVRHGLVMETRQNRLIAEFGDNPFVFVPYPAEHEALEALSEAKLYPVFQAALGFAPTAARQRRLEYESLLASSEESRLRTDLSSEASTSPGLIPGDEPGPVDIVAAVRRRNLDNYEYDGTTVVVLGSASTLGGLGFLGQIKANADLTTNLVNWAVGEQAGVSVPSKSLYRLPLRISAVAGAVYAALAIILIPLACVIAALTVYFRRRNK